MLEVQLRQAATVLLESAIRIAPPHSRDWGRAMMSELNYVEGQWAGTMWALGSSSVLAKQAIVSLIIPSAHGQDFIPDGGLFAKSAILRRAALALGGACVLAALMFFFAPPFRQAFQVATTPLHLAPANLQPSLATLARRAQKRHDSQALAFCALRLQDARESAQLADEAVRLDPNLTWVYALVGMRHPELPAIHAWVEKLQQWDPQNALFPLIAALSIEPETPHASKNRTLTVAQSHAWQAAMAAAFQSTRFEDYLERVAQLNRVVVARYRFYEPYEVESREQIALPDSVFRSSLRYAQSLFQSEANLAGKSDRRIELDNYWLVARFGQLIDSAGRTEREHRMGTTLQAMAYQQLQVAAEKDGNKTDAELFGYLAAKFSPAAAKLAGQPGESAFGRDTAERNAAVVEISGLMILIFSGLVLIALSILIAGSRKTAGQVCRRAKPVAIIVILASAVGMLFSSVTLYLTYRPYWYIFHTAVLNGDGVQTRDLQEFLASMQSMPGVSHRFNVLLDALFYSGSPGLLFYVWAGVTLLGVCGLALIVLRRFLGQTRAGPPPKRRH